MRIEALIEELNERGIYLYVEGGKLKSKSTRPTLERTETEKIKLHKPELIRFLSRHDALLDAPVARGRVGEAVLSFAQQRLWFIDQLEGGSAQYNIVSAIRLIGNLRRSVLNDALNEIVNRHAILRTTYEMKGAGCVQKIGAPAPVKIAEIDLSAVDPASQEGEVQKMLREEAARDFDLSQDLMLRATILVLGAHDHVLLLSVHHIASDGWSMGVLTREMTTLYSSYLRGLSSPLPELDIQYSDYAHWQRQRAHEDAVERQVQYWRRQLADVPRVHSLPLDRPRPMHQRFEAGAHEHRIEKPLLDRINELARRHDATLYMVMLSALSLLLARCSNESTVAIGSPIAGRNHSSLEPLIGCFVNTLVMKCSVSPRTSCSAWLRQCRQTVLEAFENQQAPLDLLVERLQPERSLSHSPLFQILFALENNDPVALQLPDLEVRGVPAQATTARFDLELFAREQEDGLHLRWIYASSIFDAATIHRLGERLTLLLEHMVHQPQADILHLPLVTEDDQRRLTEWNRTAVAYPPGRCLHELFEERVQSTPDAVALICAEGSLTYAELDARANRLAHWLRSQGVKAETLVGVCLPRCAQMLVSLLAVLKAGGAYVPLDPSYPDRRLQEMLASALPPVTLTVAAYRSRVQTLLREDALVIDVAQAEAEHSAVPSQRLLRAAVPDNLAYVIYTSGSTGRPKGVAITHSNAVAMVDWAREEFSPSVLTHALAATSICFDLSVYELFLPLSAGTAVVLVSDALALAEPAEWRPPITLINTVPSAMEALVAARAVPASVRVVNLAGEALSRSLVDRLYALGHVEAVYNLYGPSEDTTYSTGTRVERDVQAKPSIGKPISNTRAYVLDEAKSLASPGFRGELYLAGIGLARGYLGQPDLTAERFLPNPFGGPGERMYWTGDLVRYLPDGALDYLGRSDHQVKLRGFRIELEEIQRCLLDHSSVAEAAILVREDRPGEQQIVAYVVQQPGRIAAEESLVADLQVHAGQRLPHYMIPSAFVPLDALPLTRNGKLDRKALPAPQPGASGRHVELAGETERRIAAIWAELLGVAATSIGATAEFFQLGGHSLLAMRLSSALAEAFGVKVPVRALFEQHTIRAQAQYLNTLERGAYVHIPVAVRTGELPLSFAQQRLWFIDLLGGGSAQFNLPAALRLKGQLDVPALQRAFDEIVARHEILRTTFETRAGTAIQLVRPPQTVPIALLDIRHREAQEQESELRRLAREEMLRPFDLSSDLMLRAQLIVIGADDHALLVTLHHIAADGWSMALLTRELGELYAAFTRGLPSPLPALRIQYADFALWQSSEAETRLLDSQVAYWCARLAGAPTLHSLPLSRPRLAQQSHTGKAHVQRFDAPMLRGLQSLAQAHDATMFMVLMTGFSVVIARWSNVDDVVIGSPIAGRRHRDVEPLIGLFVNTLVFRSRLQPGQSFADLLAVSRDDALEAFANQDAPFELLVHKLQPARGLNHTPLFQIQFVLQSNERPEIELPGLRIASLDAGEPLIKYELSVSAVEDQGGLSLTWSYAEALFDATFIERLAASFEVLLRAASAAPQTNVFELPLVTDDDQRKLQAWNHTVGNFQVERCVHELFSAQAARTPEAIAVRAGAAQLTYRELDRRSNQLARQLGLLGMSHGQRVALCVPRSMELMIGVLGVLKSGAAYVPLDPTHGHERLAQILGDAAIEVVVTSRESVSPVPLKCVRHVWLDDIVSGECSVSEEALPLRYALDDTAYVIYTSGSTGAPKGVEVSHRGLADYCLFASGGYYRPWLTGSLLVTSHCFDLSLPSLYLPLLSGHTVSLAAVDEEFAALTAALRAGAEDSYLLRMTPTHVRTQLRLLPQREVCRARHVFVIGGEKFPASDARALRAICPESIIFNHYGPTETVIGCAMYEVPAHDESSGTLPIGKPMANTQMYVLDGHRQEVPVGVTGELYVSGDCVAKGYLKRPALTQARFITLDAGAGQRVRAYRTGDLVHWRDDGLLEYIGRTDDQVKLRGFRIEPAEIQGHLLRLDFVQDALVALKGEGELANLVAYIVVKPDARGQLAALDLTDHCRAALSQRMPAFMMPGYFVAIDRIPQTANGKVDRQALPWPVESARLVPTAPETPTEIQLASIWREILRRDEDIDATANFFDLGGHSLLSIVLLDLVERRLGVKLAPSAIYQAPLLKQFAALVDDVVTRPVDCMVRLNGHENVGGPMFLVHPVGGDVACYRDLVQGMGFGGAVFGIQHPAWVSDQPTQILSVEQLARTYTDQVRRLQPRGPYRLLGWSLGGVIALAMAEILEQAGESVAYLGLIDSVLEQESPAWTAVQQQIGVDQPLAKYLEWFEQHPAARDQFDRVNGIPALVGAGPHRLREITLANTIAARMYAGSVKVRKVHYYGASDTAARLPVQALEKMAAVSREGAQSTTLTADHFSIVRQPMVRELASQISIDLQRAR